MSLLQRSCLTAALLAAGPLAHAGVWSSHGPYGGNVLVIAAGRTSPDTPLVAFGNGGVFRSTTGGATWSRSERGLPAAAYFIDLAAATDAPVFYLADSYTVYRSIDAGESWVPTSLPATPRRLVLDLALRGDRDHVAVLTSHGVSLSSDGGVTYTDATGLDLAAYYNRIAYAADGTLYLDVTHDPNNTHGGKRLIRSVDGGASWTGVVLPILNYVSSIVTVPESPSLVYASDHMMLFGSTDGGANWFLVGTPNGCGFNGLSVAPGEPSGIYVACSDLGVAHADYSPSAAWTVYGAAQGLTANRTGDVVQTNTLAALHSPQGTPPALVAGSSAGGLFRSTDGGAAWAPANDGFTSTGIRAFATHPFDARIVLAGQAYGSDSSHGIFRSADSGASWNVSNTNLGAATVRAIVIDPTTADADPATDDNFTVYAAGESGWLPDGTRKNGGIYKSTDRGVTWTTIDNGIATVNGRPDMGLVRALYLDPRSCASPPSSGPCSAGGGPLHTIFAGGTGVPDRSAPGLPYRSARIYRSTDAGLNWMPSDNGLPLPVERPSGGLYAMGGVIAIVGDPTDGNTLYASTALSASAPPTLANGVFKTTDGGLNWVHSSEGLPRVAGAGTSHYDVLALAMSPADPQVLYAATEDPGPQQSAAVYRSADGGATWTARTSGIAGRDIRALYIDPNDATGNTVYAAVDGWSANPGGVFRTTDGGLTWNSHSLGLSADSHLALAMPPRAAGAPARVFVGTSASVWESTLTPDGDDDGAPDAFETQYDGNNDSVPDATQRNVATFASSTNSGPGLVTTAIVSGCAQLNNSAHVAANRLPPDPAGDATSHDAWGLVRIELPACANAVVDVTFHGANFLGGNHVWRNYGPKTPGDEGSFGWYSYANATRMGSQTWRLTIDATRQGNWRPDANNILFIGGPADLRDLIYANSFD